MWERGGLGLLFVNTRVEGDERASRIGGKSDRDDEYALDRTIRQKTEIKLFGNGNDVIFLM